MIPGPPDPDCVLTYRERQVLRALVAVPGSQKAAAAALQISPKTLSNHLAAIFDVLNVRTSKTPSSQHGDSGSWT